VAGVEVAGDLVLHPEARGCPGVDPPVPANERGERALERPPGRAGCRMSGDPRLHHEVAAALGISVVAAGRLVSLAWTLDCRLPGIQRGAG